jgi:hypothetical protein
MKIDQIRPMFILGAFLIILLFGMNVKATTSLSDVSIPLAVDRDQPIPISITVTSDIEIRNVSVSYQREDWIGPLPVDLLLMNGTTTNGTWAGEIPAQEWGGIITCTILAYGPDPDNYLAKHPSEGFISVEIEGAKSGFPWKWVIVGGFLVFVFIAAELAFKPGLYRRTGREKARALEEEDRRKAEEEEKTENDKPK